MSEQRKSDDECIRAIMRSKINCVTGSWSTEERGFLNLRFEMVSGDVITLRGSRTGGLVIEKEIA